MKLRTPLTALFGSLAIGACDGGETSGEIATVTGRYETSGEVASGTEAHLVSVDDDGMTQVVASSGVAADGTFRIEAPAANGPFLVEIRASGQSEVLGQVVVPHGIRSGETVNTFDIDGESRVEAGAYLAILTGAADTADVDAIGLMTWLDSELAAEVEASASLGAAYMQAQEGWLRAAAESDATITASAVAELKADAFKDLAAAGDATADAWIAFHQEARADLAAKVDLEAQANADHSAAILGSAALTGRASELAAETGATLTAHSDWALQQSVSTSAQADAQIDAAYEGFFDALAGGESMADAQAELVAELAGEGMVASDSALSTMATSEGVTAVELRAAMNSALTIRDQLDTQVSAAISGGASARVDAVVDAVIDARSAAQSHFETTLGAGSAATASLASEFFVQAGHAELLLDLDLFAALEAVLRIEGGITAEVTGAATATLSTATGNIIALGSVDGSTWSFEGVVAGDLEAALVVTLQSASGDLVGGVIVEGVSETTASGDVILVSEPVTLLSTAQVRVMSELIAFGEAAGEAITSARLEVDATLASAIDDADAANTAAASFIAAAMVRAELATEGSAELAASSANAVGSAVAADLDATSEVAWRIDAMARIESALAIGDSAGQNLAAALFSSWRTDVEVAVDAFVDAAVEADAAADVEVAWAAFAEAIWGLDGHLVDLTAALSLDAVATGLFGNAMTQSQTAMATFEASIAAAVASADLEGQGRAAFAGLTSAATNAATTLSSQLSVALDLSFMTGVSALEREGTAAFMTTVALHFAASGTSSTSGSVTP